jgi:hypothetical protein
MPDRKVLINQSLAAFARKSDATFTRLVQALQRLFVKSACLLFHYGWRLTCMPNGMKLDFIVCLGILLAILFVGIVGAFLLYVPVLTVLTVVTLLLGLGLMFALGILTGRRSRKLSPFSHRAMPIVR